MFVRKIVIIFWSIKITQSDMYIYRQVAYLLSCLLTDIAEDDVERELYLRDFGWGN